MVRYAAALLLLVAPTAGAFAQSVPVPSHWKDAQGTEISLFNIDPKGAFTGKIVSHVPGFACANVPFDLSGRAHGHHLSFSVVWKSAFQDCKAQTSYSGSVAGKSMHVWWVMTAGKKKTRGAETFVAQ
jgi:hypothetical protein